MVDAISALGPGPLTEAGLAKHIFPLFSRVLDTERIYLENHSLGRPLDQNGSMAGGNVNIPSQSDLARAREILDELRRRSGEASRAQQELEYIERLLKQF